MYVKNKVKHYIHAFKEVLLCCIPPILEFATDYNFPFKNSTLYSVPSCSFTHLSLFFLSCHVTKKLDSLLPEDFPMLENLTLLPVT